MAREERKTVLERLASAFVAGSLGASRYGTGISAADWLGALGMAASRMHPAASAMMHLYLVDDKASYSAARTATIRMAKRANARESWGLEYPVLVSLCDNALQHYICPVCPHCLGRKFERIDGTPMLSNKRCPKCKGTGMRQLPPKYARHIREITSGMNAILSDAVRGVASRVYGSRAYQE